MSSFCVYALRLVARCGLEDCRHTLSLLEALLNLCICQHEPTGVTETAPTTLRT